MAAKRTRITAAVALAAAVAIALIVAVSGGADEGDGALAWKGEVRIITSHLPTDRILYTKIENTSLEEIKLVAKDLSVEDADGNEVYSRGRYLAAFAHGIDPYAFRGERGNFERTRLGEIATLKPGGVLPLTLSWRVKKGGEQPVKVDFGPTELALP